jgi:hypothetical protein
MAAPNYNTDLTTIDTAETTTGYNQINHAGGGGGSLGVGADFSMQGTFCVDRQVTSNNRGIAFDNGTPFIADATVGDDHIFVWMYVATSGLADTLQNEGGAIMVGNATNQLVRYHVEGSDTYGAGGRVARCYPVRHNPTTNASPPYRTLTGTPSNAAQVVGCSINMTGTVKGANLGLDAQRYGTGLFVSGGEAGNAGTFSGSAAVNDSISNRWGILTRIGGTFELQGHYGIGVDINGNPSPAYFDDSNVLVQIVDTPHTDPDFTRILIDHESTTCNLTNVSFLSLGVNNRGYLDVRNASTTASFVGCVFTDFGNTFLNANVTASACTWRNSEVIYGSGSHVESCTISHNLSAGSSSLVISSLDKIIGCEFSTGSGVVNGGHAIEITQGGVTASFSGNTFTNFDANDTSGSAIFNNSGANIVINISNQGDTPTVRNGAGSTTQINNPTAFTITGIISGSEVRIHADDGEPRTELAGQESVEGTFIYSYNYGGSDVDAFLTVGNVGYEWFELPITLGNADQTQAVQQRIDRNYSNP